MLNPKGRELAVPELGKEMHRCTGSREAMSTIAHLGNPSGIGLVRNA